MPRQDYDKIVKLACKPKNAPPKAKYLDALIAGTFDDNSLQDIARSLSLRLREQNPVVVFKALITLHKLMQAGSAENLLNLLSRNDSLKLRNVQPSEHSSGIRMTSNLGSYAYYLDARIRAYRDLKHDLFQLQTESNRRSTGLGANSKARRLRHLGVDQGLLREVKQVQRILDAMVRCTFFDDNLSDENTVLAFRMVIKDMLVLFQAGNEGVCNILEHYFEMSKVDATESFEIYKSFIKQTDKIVDFLAMARKLNNVINVPVPNLKHAPTSLVKALEEYLHDPNFEQNRLEYKKSLGVVEGRAGGSSPALAGKTELKTGSSSPKTEAAASSSAPTPATQQKIQDFLDSINPDAQPTMFGGPAASTLSGTGNMQMNQFGQANQFGQMPMGMGQMSTMPTGGFGGGFGGGQFGSMPMNQPMQMQMTGANPFRQSMFGGGLAPQMTGFPNQGGQFLNTQNTGFLQPQTTGQMAFMTRRPSMSSHQPNMGGVEHLSQQPMQAQQTGFLQPQTTGSNPFRQSVLGGPSLFHSQPVSAASTPTGSMGIPSAPFREPIRSNSTPIVSNHLSSSPKPLQAQKTGSNNPFAPPGGVPAPAPQQQQSKQPTMAELSHHMMNQQFAMATGMHPQQPQQTQQQPTAPQQQSSNTSSWDPFAPTPAANGAKAGGSAMSDIASAFATDPKPSNDFTSQFGNLNFGSSNGATSPTALQPQSTGFLQPQRTGYGGSSIKPFKPSSNFGSSLMETLPPIPEPSSGAGTPAANGVSSQATGFPGMNASATGSSQPSNAFTTTNTNFTGSSQPSFGMNASATGSSQSQQISTPFSGMNGGGAFGNAFGGSGPATPSGGMTAQPTGFQPTSSFGQNLVAANPAPLQAQATGSNPFRQSMMMGGGGMGGIGTGGGGMGGGVGGGGVGSSPFGAFPSQQKQQQASLLG